jgi:triacylglycerol esterase/lipase EstA (alpha/beta hydrolase family)
VIASAQKSALRSPWLREAIAVARQGMLIATRGGNYREHAESPALTVFVHGYFAGGGVFEPLGRWLANERIAPRQLHFAYGPYGTVRGLAQKLARRIEAVHGDGPVHIVGHSLGGVIGRYYVQMLGGRAERIVCLASPHYGTVRAKPWTAMPLAREIAPGSETLRALHETRSRLHSVKVCCVVAEEDNMVLPVESAILEGHESVRLAGVGHHSVLFDANAWRHVSRALTDDVTHRATG